MGHAAVAGCSAMSLALTNSRWLPVPDQEAVAKRTPDATIRWPIRSKLSSRSQEISP